MKPNNIKRWIRALGAIIGLIGCIGSFSCLLFIAASVKSLSGIDTGIALSCAALYSYFTYIGYLVWFRWSPLAVQNVVGFIAFFLSGIFGGLCIVPQLHVLQHGSTASRAVFILFLCGSFLIYAAYSWCSAYCCARLFPPAASSAPGVV